MNDFDDSLSKYVKFRLKRIRSNEVSFDEVKKTLYLAGILTKSGKHKNLIKSKSHEKSN